MTDDLNDFEQFMKRREEAAGAFHLHRSRRVIPSVYAFTE